MARLVAGIYEIQQQIGSGGGGVVYLGRHLRLNKLVVLKADKRSLNTKPEILRREVDMLKGLSHTYIPQVYDFVQEDGIVYTVMDYIEGESLDQILKRGKLPPQPQLITWACQLLEALCYLHGQPPHGILHADIKPANIMLRPNGDICLIDYNIALALGEDGAVKAGYSIGYASPEHYGLEGSGSGSSGSGTESSAQNGSRSESGTGTGSQSGRRAVMLDVRSDIYSLGATLYHLISGKRPPKDPRKLEPLDAAICSPAVAEILKKAMALEPEQRYQTAEEMLTAFRRLHTRDKRVIRRRRRMAVAASFLTLLFLAGGAITFVGLKQMEQRQSALALAEYSADELAKGNVSGAVELALQAIPLEKSIWNAPVTSQARKALTDALGVYQLSDTFQSLDVVSLPAAPYKIVLSPDGTRFAAICQSEAAVFDTESRRQIAALPMADSALADALFADSSHFIYAGAQGVSLYDLETGSCLWTVEPAASLTVSGDGMVVAAISRESEKAVFYNRKNGSVLGECSFEGKKRKAAFNDIFADPGDDIFSLNEDGTLLAVSFSKGELWIYDWKHPEEELILYEESDYDRFEGGFCGTYFAFTAGKGDQYLFGLVDTEQAVYVGEMESRKEMHLAAREEGIWLSEGNLLVRLDPETLEDTEVAFTNEEVISGFDVDDGLALVTTKTPGFSFYDRAARQMSREESGEEWEFAALAGGYGILANRNQPSVRLMKLQDHREAQILSYDARYPHDEARLNGEGNAMLFDYEGFCLFDRDGTVLAEGEFPYAGEIYDQQFCREADGEWLEVIWYDGTVRRYSAADGSLLEEWEEEPPSKTLQEEFLTEQYRIVSELHGAPKVYDRETGQVAGELEKDSYLTYVTETGEYIVTEYVSAQGERYGLLLDQNLQTLAYLPGLCDIVDGRAIFDDQSGNLRQSRIYSLQELIALGEAHKEEEK